MMKLLKAGELKLVKLFILFYGSILLLSLIFHAAGASPFAFELALGKFGMLGVVLLLLSKKAGVIWADIKRVRAAIIPFCILTGLVLTFFARWYQDKASLYGMEVSPGARQVNFPESCPDTVDAILIGVVVVLVSPVLEEILFRFIGLGIVQTIITASQVITTKYVKLFNFFWIIIISTIFSLLHGPDWLSFPVYFISSMAFSLFYLKYGLMASILVHSSGNGAAYIYAYIYPQ